MNQENWVTDWNELWDFLANVKHLGPGTKTSIESFIIAEKKASYAEGFKAGTLTLSALTED